MTRSAEEYAAALSVVVVKFSLREPDLTSSKKRSISSSWIGLMNWFSFSDFFSVVVMACYFIGFAQEGQPRKARHILLRQLLFSYVDPFLLSSSTKNRGILQNQFSVFPDSSVNNSIGDSSHCISLDITYNRTYDVNKSGITYQNK